MHFEKLVNIYICTRFSSIDNDYCYNILHLTTGEFQMEKKPVVVFVIGLTILFIRYSNTNFIFLLIDSCSKFKNDKQSYVDNKVQ